MKKLRVAFFGGLFGVLLSALWLNKGRRICFQRMSFGRLFLRSFSIEVRKLPRRLAIRWDFSWRTAR